MAAASMRHMVSRFPSSQWSLLLQKHFTSYHSSMKRQRIFSILKTILINRLQNATL